MRSGKMPRISYYVWAALISALVMAGICGLHLAQGLVGHAFADGLAASWALVGASLQHELDMARALLENRNDQDTQAD